MSNFLYINKTDSVLNLDGFSIETFFSCFYMEPIYNVKGCVLKCMNGSTSNLIGSL